MVDDRPFQVIGERTFVKVTFQSGCVYASLCIQRYDLIVEKSVNDPYRWYDHLERMDRYTFKMTRSTTAVRLEQPPGLLFLSVWRVLLVVGRVFQRCFLLMLSFTRSGRKGIRTLVLYKRRSCLVFNVVVFFQGSRKRRR